jgi:hypothetical protein
MASPLNGPVLTTFSDCHVFPPSKLCQTQLVDVNKPLITAQPSLLFARKAMSAALEQVSQSICS